MGNTYSLYRQKKLIQYLHCNINYNGHLSLCSAGFTHDTHSLKDAKQQASGGFGVDGRFDGTISESLLNQLDKKSLILIDGLLNHIGNLMIENCQLSGTTDNKASALPFYTVRRINVKS
ncbi:hypothetical protein GALL_388990 [mine drainage metagenome]|uniref:Uncharacterized protein n=1 Tax=mine drainage metagenome TaxID=410659 RepID=A0A1J5QTY4_9ZZZZ